MENSRLSYLRAMGVDVYLRRHASAGVPDDMATDQLAESAEDASAAEESTQATVQSGQTPASICESATRPNVTNSPSVAEPTAASVETKEPAKQPVSESSAPTEPPASSVPTTAATQQDAEPAGPPDFDEEPPLPDSPYAPSIQLDDEAEQAEATAEPDPVASMNWEDLRKTVAVCERCELHSTRTQSVFGVGHPNARLMVIGEAPGRDEDLQGEPFVGKAGKLLDQMLKAAGFERKDVFIANILKCRPPKNRDPKAEEAAACRAYLNRQIELVQPEVILSVGRISAQNLLDSEQSIGRLRGQAHRLPGRDVPLFVTYHPAYLLRQPAEKRKAWADLQMVMSALGL